MANIVTTAIQVDGPRNAVIKVDGILDSSDLVPFVIADPRQMWGVDGTGTVKAAGFTLEYLQYSIEDLLELRLAWDGITAGSIGEFTGRGKLKAKDWGGVRNNAGGPTGKITLSTQGWVAGAVLSFTLLLHLAKQSRLP